MVTGRDRGQLLLVTAVILAMIVLGVAVLLNAASTTEVRSPDDPSTDLVEADRLASDIERGSAGLAGHVNAMGPYEDTDALAAELDTAFTSYGDLLYESVGDRRATLLEVGDVAVVEHGTYLVDPNQTSPVLLGDDDGIRIDPERPAAIAGLRLSLAVDTLDDEPEESLQLHLNGTETGAAIAIVATGSGAALYHTTYDLDDGPSFDAATPHACAAEDFVEVDLTRAGVAGDDCHVGPFDGFDPVDGAHGLAFVNAEGVHGAYHLVVGDEPARFVEDGPFERYDGDESVPSVSPVAWSIGFDLAQWARASERHASPTVTVYDHPRSVAALEVPWP